MITFYQLTRLCEQDIDTLQMEAPAAVPQPNGIKRGSRNPSLQVTADHQIKICEAPIKEPRPGEVLLHIRATGICGSDIHFWKRGAIGSLTVDGDCILGHEAAGVVLKCGEGVKNFTKGVHLIVRILSPHLTHRAP